MKESVLISGAIIAFISSTQAVSLRKDPDVYGPNGDDYENDSATYDLSRIGIDIKKKGKGKKCAEGDWTTVAWKGYLKDGRLVTDSTQDEDGRPKTFALGNADVFKCWELAIPQLKKGAKATLSCPEDLAWGGAYTPAPIGGEPVPEHSDIDFDIEIIDCNRTPEHKTKQEVQPRTTTMQPNACMYLHLEEGDHTGYDLVLSTEEDDFSEFWPAKYVMLEQKVVDDPAQQWYWNEKDGTLHNAANKDYFLQNDLGWVMVAKESGPKKSKKDDDEDEDDDKKETKSEDDDDDDDGESKKKKVKSKKTKKTKADDFPTGKRKWYYNAESGGIETDVMGIKAEVTIFGQPKNWAEVELSPVNKQVGTYKSKFRIEYCFDGPRYQY